MSGDPKHLHHPDGVTHRTAPPPGHDPARYELERAAHMMAHNSATLGHLSVLDGPVRRSVLGADVTVHIGAPNGDTYRIAVCGVRLDVGRDSAGSLCVTVSDLRRGEEDERLIVTHKGVEVPRSGWWQQQIEPGLRASVAEGASRAVFEARWRRRRRRWLKTAAAGLSVALWAVWSSAVVAYAVLALRVFV